MNKTACTLIFTMVICALLSGCVTKSIYVELEKDYQNHVAQSNEQLNEFKKQIERLEVELHKSKTSISGLEVEKRKLETEKLQLINQLDNIKDNVVQLKQDLHRKQTIIKTQKKVIAQVNETKKQIEHSLKKQIASQEIKIEEMEGKLKLTFVDKILFNSGSASINIKGKEALLQIADSLRNQTNNYNFIRVEGHTDNLPIAEGPIKKVFPSNWELSAARAISVVRFLELEGGIDPLRLCISAYSFYRPVDTNETPEGRMQNRRIEIILTP
ncbi:MAG: chemotaxis protein MotB [Candidatus Magnetoglobus multicellularis str. Araruama]|uniref:Chemotaxis protein MotB n=1 Tax=Candidatus Magnetoglobus multicellularis str. Araruama TaxID=890399 RepID=A0A1V1P601_9BACT|nr:MAG: chemotaxis protein MotB [Candidatus Magnetoglobus multicellularis str. Araruama]